jgi:predicted MFS family arabinose efflux permease
MGMIAGPWLTAQIVTRSEMGALLATIAAVATMMLCLSLAPLSPIRHAKEVQEEPQPGVSNGFFRASLLTNTMIWIGVGVLRFLLPKRVVDLNHAPAVLGNLYLVCYGVMLAGFIWMKMDPRWHSRRWPMMTSLVLGALGASLLGMTDRLGVLVLGLALFGQAIALSYYTVLFAALDRPIGRGWRSSQHEAALAAGMMIGSQIGGILAESVGPRAPYGGVACMCLLGMGVVWWLAGSPAGAAITPAPDQASR